MKWCKSTILFVSVALALGQENLGSNVAGGNPPPKGPKANSPPREEEGNSEGKPNTRFFGGLGQQGLGAGLVNSGFGQPGLVNSGFGQPGLVNSGFGQPGINQQFLGQGIAGLGQGLAGLVPGLGQPFAPSLFAQPGVGSNSFGLPTLSGTPVTGPGGRPAISAPSASCRQWCPGTRPGQFYCCDDNSKPATVPIVKPGSCPPRRPLCPKFHGPPQTCGDDSKCSGYDKCCLDTCLQVHVCKPPLF